jgi:hypothetical protein
MTILAPGNEPLWLAAVIAAAAMLVRFVLIPDEPPVARLPFGMVWCQRCEAQVPMTDLDDCCPYCKLVL